MTAKADFNAAEWETLVEGLLLAGMRLVLAARGGTLRESLALGQAYAEARRAHGDSELLDQLVAAPPTMDPAQLPPAGEIGRVTSERLGQALGLLKEKASPDEIDAYKRFALTLAQAAAEAHREGGVLGVGGAKVSPDEQAALDELAAVLERPS